MDMSIVQSLPLYEVVALENTVSFKITVAITQQCSQLSPACGMMLSIDQLQALIRAMIVCSGV